MKPTSLLYSPHFLTEVEYTSWLKQLIRADVITTDKLRSIPDNIAHITGHQYKRVLLKARAWAKTEADKNYQLSSSSGEQALAVLTKESTPITIEELDALNLTLRK